MLRKCQGELLKSDHNLVYVSFLPHDFVTGRIPPDSSRHLPLLSFFLSFSLYFLNQVQFRRKIPNALPKNPDNTRKNDYEEQDLEQTKTVDRVVFPEMKLEKVWKKSLASPAAIKSNRECFKV